MTVSRETSQPLPLHYRLVRVAIWSLILCALLATMGGALALLYATWALVESAMGICAADPYIRFT